MLAYTQETTTYEIDVVDWKNALTFCVQLLSLPFFLGLHLTAQTIFSWSKGPITIGFGISKAQCGEPRNPVWCRDSVDSSKIIGIQQDMSSRWGIKNSVIANELIIGLKTLRSI